MTFNIQSLADLTATQRLGLYDVLSDVKNAKSWSWELPVLLRDRCWLRLDRIQLSQLMRQLPPQGREEAPELVRYRLLIEEGFEPLTAQQTCWNEYGMEDCQRALRAYWRSQEQADHGWTARRYRQLVSLYRNRIERGVATVPMLVLARRDSTEQHQVLWITAPTAANDWLVGTSRYC